MGINCKQSKQVNYNSFKNAAQRDFKVLVTGNTSVSLLTIRQILLLYLDSPITSDIWGTASAFHEIFPFCNRRLTCLEILYPLLSE